MPHCRVEEGCSNVSISVSATPRSLSNRTGCTCQCRAAWPARRGAGRRPARRRQTTESEAPLSELCLRRFPDWLVQAEVPRLRFDSPEAIARIRRREPVVLIDAPLCAHAVGKWDLHYLGAEMAGYPFWKVQIVRSARQLFQRIYGAGLAEGAIEEMSFAEFMRLSAGNGQYSYYLQTQLLGNNSDIDVITQRFGGKHPFGEAMRADINGFDWHWLQTTLDAGNLGKLEHCQLWIGRGGAVTPAHFDSMENLFVQILGRKRFLLFSPDQVFNLYPYPAWHTLDSYSMVDFERPDLERFPAFQQACALEAVLDPGDILYLPKHWFHHVHALLGDNASLSFWSDRPPAGSLQAGFLAAELKSRPLLACRVAESAAAKSLSGGFGLEVRPGEFLTAIATGCWPPHATMQLRRLGEQLRMELVRHLGGEDAAETTLRGMTRDGRLDPGPPLESGAEVIHAEKGTVGGYWQH